MRPLLLAIFALFAIGSVRADDCIRSRSVYQQTFVAPAIVTVPTYNYSYAQTTLLVPQVLEVQTQAAHYYSIADGYQSAQVIDAVTRLLQQERAAYQQPQAAPQQAVPPPQPVQPPLPSPGPLRPNVSSPKASSFQDPALVSLIANSCVKCHADKNKMPLLTPDNKALLDLNRQQALTVYWLVNTGAMPKTAPPVDDKYMPLFAKWIEASK